MLGDTESTTRLALVHELMRAVAAEPDTTRLLEAAARAACTLTQGSGAQVVTMSDDRRAKVIEAQSGDDPGDAGTAVAQALAAGRPIVEVPLAGSWARLCLPIASPSPPERVIVVRLAPRHRPGPFELELCALLATHLGLALERAAALAAAARRVARVEEHAQALRRIAESGSPEAVIERALDAATTLLGADRAAFYRLGSGDRVTAVWSRRLSRGYCEAVAKTFHAAAGGLLARLGAPLVLGDVTSDPRTRALHEVSRHEGLRAALLVPVDHRGRSLGALALYHDIAWSYEPEELALVRSFADQLALSLTETARDADLAERVRQLRLLQELVAATAEHHVAGEPIERCERGLAALVAGGLPSVWLYLRRGRSGAGPLELVVRAGASALDPRVPERAARAALSVRRTLTHVGDDGTPLHAAPLGQAHPVGALVVAPPVTPGLTARPGTLLISLERESSAVDLDLFVATAAAELYSVFGRAEAPGQTGGGDAKAEGGP
jgi:hypothetical protein